MNWRESPHKRLNPLTREWVLVSPQRTERPWQGQIERRTNPVGAEFDETCYLCPGNKRVGGFSNPNYKSTFVFDNDFSALRPETPQESFSKGSLLVAESEKGICRVVCFSPSHNLTISRMGLTDLRSVVDTWIDQYRELGTKSFVQYVQIFENRGEMMGASNPHPHGQIWATSSLPNEIMKEHSAQCDYLLTHKTCLLCDYLEIESSHSERLVCENDSFAAFVPFWAVWPFETLIVSKRHLTGLDQLAPAESDGLAAILKSVTTRYDNLFEVPFPYTMGFHSRPTDGSIHDEWHFHAHLYPPLLRSASVRKFMVGFELLAMPQRDITPESAAARLKRMTEVHYLHRGE